LVCSTTHRLAIGTNPDSVPPRLTTSTSMPSSAPWMARSCLNPASTHARVTVEVCSTTLSSNRTPIALSVTDAAVTTTAMISPSASTASPRFRPGIFLPASLPVVAAGTWFAARID
jgi:hypothetical protein